jgi:hypothetical protein
MSFYVAEDILFQLLHNICIKMLTIAVVVRLTTLHVFICRKSDRKLDGQNVIPGIGIQNFSLYCHVQKLLNLVILLSIGHSVWLKMTDCLSLWHWNFLLNFSTPYI